MRKKITLFSMLFLLALFISPIGVKASIGGNENVYMDFSGMPKIGQKQVHVQSTQNVEILEEYWVNNTDHKRMEANDVFEAKKAYTYTVRYSVAPHYITEWWIASEGSEYYLSGGSLDDEEYSEASISFYFGDLSDLDVDPGDVDPYDGAILDISVPQLGGHRVSARTNSKYTIESESWYNYTDSRAMTEDDVFEANKYYVYTVTYTTYYSDWVFLNNFENSTYYLGEMNDDTIYTHSYEKTHSACFYFGDADSDLIINNGDIVAESANTPLAGGTLNAIAIPNVTGIDTAYSYWTVVGPNDEFYDVKTGVNVEVGIRYRWNASVFLMPGYSFADDFNFTNENVNNGMVETFQYVWNRSSEDRWSKSNFSYYADYLVLPEGATIGIKGETHLIYPTETTVLDVYPENEDNQNVTWASSDEDIAEIDETGEVIAHQVGNVVITATNSKGETAEYELEVGVKAESIVVENHEIHMHIGDRIPLSASLTPANVSDYKLEWNYEWSGTTGPYYPIYIENNNVLVAKDLGTGKVFVTTPSNRNLVEEITVYVEEREAEVTDVTFNETEFEIYTGSTTTIMPTITPSNATDQELTWINTNEAVASYDPETHKLTALTPGSTVIVARSANGKQATCMVTVKQRPPMVESISFTEEELTMDVGTNQILQYVINPSNAYSETYNWTSSNTNVVRVDNTGKVRAVGAGTATVTLETDNHKIASCDITVLKVANFSDVPKTAWYYQSVKKAYQRNIIAGYSETKFGPNDKVTRGQLVTFLWRIEGQPSGSSLPSDFFKDVGNTYYTDAVFWAFNTGVVHGYSKDKFGPNDPITRKDLAVILNNYAKHKGLPYTAEQDLSIFADYKLVKGGYAEPALKWAVKYGVMHGQDKKGKKYIAPIDNTTRAEAATMIVNFLDNFGL